MAKGLLGDFPSPPQKIEVYATFAGIIDQMAVQKVFNAITTVSSTNVDHIHLLMQSSGGLVGDGVCLYNFFRNLNIGLTIYNGGQICSIATLVYLGVKERKARAPDGQLSPYPAALK